MFQKIFLDIFSENWTEQNEFRHVFTFKGTKHFTILQYRN